MEPEDDDIPVPQPHMLRVVTPHHVSFGMPNFRAFLFANKDGIVIGSGIPMEPYQRFCPISGKFLLGNKELPVSCDAYTDVHLASKAWDIRTWAAEVFED